MRLQGETRELMTDLTPEEVDRYAQELAAAVQDLAAERKSLEEWEAGVKESRKRRKAGIEEFEEEADRLAEIVQSGRAKKDITLSWLYSLEHGWAFLVRDDTGERIQSRKLKDEERQLTIGEPPFAEPTPEELEEWLQALPVNEEEVLPEGHGVEVEPSDRALTLTEDVDWGDASDEPGAMEQDEILDEEIDHALYPEDDGDADRAGAFHPEGESEPLEEF